VADQSLESLRIRLVGAGVSPRYARRLVDELETHWHDLAADLQQRGVAQNEASTLARRRLGTEDDIVACVLATGRFRSFGRRWPWLVFLVGPVLAFPVLVVAMTVLLGLAFMLLSMEFGWLTMEQAIHLYLLGFVVMLPIVPCAIAVWIALHGRSRCCPIAWPLAGIVLLSLFAGLLSPEFGPATDTLPGMIGTATFYRLLFPTLPLACFATLWFIMSRVRQPAHHSDIVYGA
jgi:hypothetical protein